MVNFNKSDFDAAVVVLASLNPKYDFSKDIINFTIRSLITLHAIFVICNKQQYPEYLEADLIDLFNEFEKMSFDELLNDYLEGSSYDNQQTQV